MVHDPRFHNEDGELVRMAISPRPYQDSIPIYQMAESPASIERSARRRPRGESPCIRVSAVISACIGRLPTARILK